MRSVAILLAILLAAPLGAVIVDRVAAVIDRDVITLSEVEQLVALRMIPREAGESDRAYRRKVLEAMIAQALRYRDVERFGGVEIPKDAIAAEMEELIERFGSREELEETLEEIELTLAEVEALIKRQLQVDAYIDERFSPLIFVSLEEIERYYRDVWVEQRRRRGLPLFPLSDVSEEIRDLLKAERIEAEIENWTEQLRERANVDIFVYR